MFSVWRFYQLVGSRCHYQFLIVSVIWYCGAELGIFLVAKCGNNEESSKLWRCLVWKFCQLVGDSQCLWFLVVPVIWYYASFLTILCRYKTAMYWVPWTLFMTTCQTSKQYTNVRNKWIWCSQSFIHVPSCAVYPCRVATHKRRLLN